MPETQTEHPWNIAQRLASRLRNGTPPSEVAENSENWPFSSEAEVQDCIDEANASDNPHRTLSKEISKRLRKQPQELSDEDTLNDWNTAQRVASSLLKADNAERVLDSAPFPTPKASVLSELIAKGRRMETTREGVGFLARELQALSKEDITEKEVSTPSTETSSTNGKQDNGSEAQEPKSEIERAALELVRYYLNQDSSIEDPIEVVGSITGYRAGRTELRMTVINAPGGSIQSKSESVGERLQEWKEEGYAPPSRTTVGTPQDT